MNAILSRAGQWEIKAVYILVAQSYLGTATT